MQKMMSKTSQFVLLVLVLTSTQALSQGASPSSAEERACVRDVQKHCKDAVSSNDLVLQCLKAHAAELRPACHKVLTDNHQL
jgi:hypothetical protein